jgi:hypothetical protein
VSRSELVMKLRRATEAAVSIAALVSALGEATTAAGKALHALADQLHEVEHALADQGNDDAR